MQQVIIAIHLMVVTALVILVLYQKSEGGALGMGGSGVFTGRGQANALTRATGILATIFFITSIALTVLPAWERRAAGGDDWTKAIDQDSIKFKELKPEDKGAKPGEAAPVPEAGKDSIFEQLQRAQQKRQQTAPAEPAPAPPAAPAPAAPAAEKPALRPSQEPPKAPEAAAPAEAPKVEAPKTEAPKSEAPKWESPKTEAPAGEAPKSEAPAVDAPKAEAPKTEAAPVAPAAPAPEVKPAETKPAAPTIWKSPTQ
ncbi:preprotein translocase subunit SecG [Methylocystis sp. ATCC 49242]|uniref:preprotein translocase subunit SecG n=1 Tax=Methylocystis sp. ATCC 49242 TaxID=622637 RepID=UPI0001F87E53|nr:preprotein translocase subunit SecG [Methylocystis sp. ATCC 49242]